MNLDSRNRIAVVVFSILSIIAVILPTYEFLASGSIHIEGMDGFMKETIVQFGFPAFFLALSYYYLTESKRKGDNLPFLTVVFMICFGIALLIIAFTIGFFLTISLSLLYAFLIAWIVDLIHFSGFVNPNLLMKWVFFFFVAEFFFMFVRHLLGSGIWKAEVEKINKLKKSKLISEKIALGFYVTASILVSLKVLASFAYLAYLFGVISDISIDEPVTAIVALLATLGGIKAVSFLLQSLLRPSKRNIKNIKISKQR